MRIKSYRRFDVFFAKYSATQCSSKQTSEYSVNNLIQWMIGESRKGLKYLSQVVENHHIWE
jgi:hypothetical protein